MAWRRVLTGTAAVLAVLASAACTPHARFQTPAGASTAVPPVPDAIARGYSDPVRDPVYPDYGNASVDVLHYGLDLSYDPDTTVLDGVAVLRIRPVHDESTLVLDFAGGFDLGETTVDGAPADAEQDGDKLIVDTATTAGEVIELTVAYSGVPERVPAPSESAGFQAEGLGLRAEADGSLWTMQEPYGAFTWYPVNDQPSDKALYDIAVTVPDGWTAVANGRLADRTEAAGGTTFTWHSADPVASYLTTLAVDRFTELDRTGPHGLPISVWAAPGYAEALTPVADRMPDLIAYLENRFGPYPFESAGVVFIDGASSAMETQQMITFSALITGDGTDTTLGTLLHELSHQWFGDAVTPRDWRGVWLSEGMATYAEDTWSIDQGWYTLPETLADRRERDQAARDEAGPPGAYDPGRFAASNVYTCAGLMFFELRARIGEEAFTAMMRDWVQAQRGTTQDRVTFTAWVNGHAGQDLGPLVDAWLDSPTTPA